MTEKLPNEWNEIYFYCIKLNKEKQSNNRKHKKLSNMIQYGHTQKRTDQKNRKHEENKNSNLKHMK